VGSNGALVPAGELRRFAASVAEAVGVPREDAETIADAMVWAELRGLDIGIKRLPTLVARIKAGTTTADPRPAVVHETGAFAVLEGDHAWGQVTSVRGMRIAIEKARGAGIGACVVRNTGNSLAMGYYPSIAVRERMIGVAITNALPLVPPWGGSRKLFGNQAYAMGCPAGRHAPILFDTAATALSWVAIHGYESRGERLPPGLALTASGEPTVDPHEALAGILLPAGGYKGYGLTLMWEILTGILSGGEVFAPLPNSLDPKQRSGQSTFLLAIDPAASMPIETFLERVDTLIDRIHATPPAPGSEPPHVPGERGVRVATERERDGIPMDAARVAELRALGDSVGVTVPAAMRGVASPA
jgi:LDH2 family malate/lactate/ureidoglycolate dehydrogenase